MNAKCETEHFKLTISDIVNQIYTGILRKEKKKILKNLLKIKQPKKY